MAVNGGGISVTLTLDDQLSGGLMRANAQVNSFGNSMSNLIRGVEAARGSIAILKGDIEGAMTALAAFGAGASVAGGVAAGFVEAAKQAAEYQRQVQLIQNNTTLTDTATKNMSDTIMKMSVQTGSALNDLGQGFMRISNFGNDAADATVILAEANKSAIETGAKVVDVANAGAAIMHEYGASVNQTSQYFNTLAEASKLGNTTQQEFVDGSSRAIAVAANLGVSFKDVAASMDTMTRHGFDMSAASTQMTSLMKNIVDPTTGARAEIEKLSKSTGVDLVYDFSQAGLQAKGLVGIMDDLRAAVGNNSSEIFKLIPALRGGQAALVLSGVGNQDLHISEGELTDTMNGLNKPIEDGFERMQKTASQQFAILRANVTRDAIEIGNGLMQLAGPMAHLLAMAPPGVVSGGAQAAGTVALAFFANAGLNRLAGSGGPTMADREQYQQQLVDYQKYQEEMTTFRAKERTARMEFDTQVEQAEASHQARMQAIMQEGIARQAEINANAFAGGGFGPGYAAQRAAAQENMAAKQAASEDSRNAIYQGAAADMRNRTGFGPQYVPPPTALQGPGKLAQFGAGLQEAILPITIMMVAQDVVFGPLETKVNDSISKWIADRKSKPINLNLGFDPAQAAANAGVQIEDLQKQIDNAQAQKASQGSGVLGFLMHHGPFSWSGVAADSPLDALISDNERKIEILKQQAKNVATIESGKPSLVLPGAAGTYVAGLADVQSSRLLGSLADQSMTLLEVDKAWNQLAATYGRFIPNFDVISKGFEDNTKAIKSELDANAELLAQQRDEATHDFAMGVPFNIVDRAVMGKNADGTDATKEQQAQAKRDIQDISKAWTDAATAVGKIDMTKGVSGLAAVADDLGKATDTLSRFGLGNAALSDVTGMADSFKALADTEKAATAQLDGYMLNLNQTATYLKEIDSLQKGFNSAVDDAQTRALAGTANSADLGIIGQRTSVNATLTQQRNALGQRQSSDWLNITQVLPNWERLDQISRDLVQSFGGGQVLMARVDADVSAAQNAIDTMINHPYKLNLTADMASLFHDIVPGSWLDNLFHGGGASGSSGGGTGGGTMTANGDATILQQYASSIKNYAGQAHIDPALIGAIIMEESGGKAGIPNSTGSGATGLMQVMPGQGYDMSRMSGSDFASTDYQIYAGTDLLQKKLATYGGDMDAALTSYGFGVGSNHSIDQLKSGYLNQSRQALSGTGGNGDDQGGGAIDSAANTVRSQIVAKAVSQVGQDKLVGYCEQWVEDTVQGILGNRGPAYGANQAGSAKTALAYYQSQGMVRGAGQEPQPGDLVYYGSGSDGHVAIYVGGGKQASTWDQGAASGTNRQIHIEQVGAGAQYVALPGSGYMADNGGPNITSGIPGAGTINGQNQRPSNYHQPSLSELDSIVKTQSSAANTNIANLGTQSAIDVSKALQERLPALEQSYAIMSGIPTQLQNANDKYTFQEEALAKSNQLAADQAKYMYDVQNNAAAVGDDITKMNADAGDMAAAVKAQADDWLNISGWTAIIKADQQAMTDLNQKRQQQLDQEKIQDESLARGKQEQQWTQQLTDHSQQLAQQTTRDQWQLQSDMLDDKKTKEQRGYEDAVSNADRQHTLATRNYDDQLKALERLQVTQQSSDSEQERVLKAQALGPGNLQQKFQAGEQLSIQIDYDQRQKQNMIDQINNQKNLQIVETRNYEDQKYQLDQAHTIATRNFQDEATQATRNQQIIEQGWQKIADQEWTTNFNRQKADTEAAWALQDKRDKETQLYQLDKASLDLKTKNDQQNLDDSKLIQQYNDQIFNDWTKTIPLVQQASDILFNGATSVINGQGSKSSSGSTISPGDVGHHASGGMITTPYAVVGENGPELISAMGYYVSPNRGTSGGSSTVNVNVNVAGNMGFTAADEAEIEACVQRIMARKGAASNPSSKARGRY